MRPGTSEEPEPLQEWTTACGPSSPELQRAPATAAGRPRGISRPPSTPSPAMLTPTELRPLLQLGQGLREMCSVTLRSPNAGGRTHVLWLSSHRRRPGSPVSQRQGPSAPRSSATALCRQPLRPREDRPRRRVSQPVASRDLASPLLLGHRRSCGAPESRWGPGEVGPLPWGWAAGG